MTAGDTLPSQDAGESGQAKMSRDDSDADMSSVDLVEYGTAGHRGARTLRVHNVRTPG